MYYVYILKWDKYYIWYTFDIERRIERHILWWCKTTKKLKVYELVWYFEKEAKSDAMKLEKIIKKNWHTEHWINHESFIISNKIIH